MAPQYHEILSLRSRRSIKIDKGHSYDHETTLAHPQSSCVGHMSHQKLCRAPFLGGHVSSAWLRTQDKTQRQLALGHWIKQWSKENKDISLHMIPVVSDISLVVV